MPTPTYTPLANITLTGNDSVISFTNIPSTVNGVSLRDLRLIIRPKGNEINSAQITINGVNTGYSRVRMYNAGSAGSDTGTNNAEFFFTTTNDAVCVFDFLDAFATDKHKTWLQRDSESSRYVAAVAGRYASTAAISSITISSNPVFTYVAGASFDLYGIAG